MRLQEIIRRLAEIETELRGGNVTQERFTALQTEAEALLNERAQIEGEQQRNSLLERIAGGSAGTVTRTFGGADGASPSPAPSAGNPQTGRQERHGDPFDTVEYRTAFMEYVCRGVRIPAELRADAVTTSTDASAVIPTTMMNEIIKKMESYGSVFAGVRKTDIQGGVEVPILTLKPTANWIGEAASSDDQKIQANQKVSFSYYGLECKIAQTLLASVVTLEIFQREFVNLATEAIVKALEIGIFNGTGSGRMTGVTVDTRVPAANKITIAPADFKTWAGWKKNVFAKMKKSYRNGVFFMAQGTFDAYIDGMVDTTGQPIGRVNYGIDGEERYRFGGKTVETVEDECIKSYDDASTGDVVAVFMRLSDYAINSNMQMRVVKWEDHDDNQVKNKCVLICDGKALDTNGILIIKKGAAT